MPRTATYSPKSASPACATLLSQLQPLGTTVTTFLVPTLPVELDKRHLVRWWCTMR